MQTDVHDASLVLPVGLACCQSHSPTTQRLMSGPSSMPSGQAHVYLGECSVICGAFRHRYSHPPLGKLPMLQASGAGGTEAESTEDPTGLSLTLGPFNGSAFTYSLEKLVRFAVSDSTTTLTSVLH